MGLLLLLQNGVVVIVDFSQESNKCYKCGCNHFERYTPSELQPCKLVKIKGLMNYCCPSSDGPDQRHSGHPVCPDQKREVGPQEVGRRE